MPEEVKKEETKPVETPTEKPIKPNKRRTKRVDISSLEKRATTVLDREINYLLDASHGGKLCKDDSTCLRDYLKTIRDLKKDEDEYLDSLSDEDLAKEAQDDPTA